jgi:lipopolysaccharide export system permease protein
MYILTRYVVLEVLKLFLAALAGLTLVVTLAFGVQTALKFGLPPTVMLKTLPFLLPEMFGITIPVAMLFAVSSVFGRMTGMNEIVAIKSLGHQSDGRSLAGVGVGELSQFGDDLDV